MALETSLGGVIWDLTAYLHQLSTSYLQQIKFINFIILRTLQVYNSSHPHLKYCVSSLRNL